MLLEEVRRRNLVRIGLMAFAAMLNYFVGLVLLALLLAAVVASDTPSKDNPEAASGDSSGAFVQMLLIGSVVAAVFVVVLVVKRTVGASRATVKALGPGVADGATDRRLTNLTEELAIAAGIKPVHVAILDDEAPNALSVGVGRGMTVVVTTGLLDQLTRDEMEAVLAAEMCAIRRLDVALRTTIVACTSGAIALHDDTKASPNRNPDRLPTEVMEQAEKTLMLWPVRVFAWPSWRVALRLRQAAYSHGDMGADDMAVAITRNPDALRRALEKVLDDPGVVHAVTPINAPLWLEPLPEPMSDRQGALVRHSMNASLEDRIARLTPAR